MRISSVVSASDGCWHHVEPTHRPSLGVSVC